jgi:hypothetical protein
MSECIDEALIWMLAAIITILILPLWIIACFVCWVAGKGWFEEEYEDWPECKPEPKKKRKRKKNAQA